MKEIIVLGGGFAGVSALLSLKKKISEDEANITLIDKNSYHLFIPSIYEVATKEEPKKNIAIPFTDIFSNKVKHVRGVVSNIDTHNHLIHLKDNTNYSYDYLIIALGSESEFFGIEGLEEHSLPLKDLEDAVKIQKIIEENYHAKVPNNKHLSIVIGGGGLSGTEFTAELVHYKEHLAKHHELPKDLVKITIIQGSSRLLKDLDEKVSEIAKKRLENEGVEVVLETHIKKVEKGEIETDTGKKYKYDVFIWAGGVRANKVLEESNLKTNGKGQLPVNDKLQVNGFNNIFAVGDVAQAADPITNKPAPGVAQVAEDEGKIAAENIYKSLKNQDLISYKFFHAGYIVPLKGRFSVVQLMKFRIVGYYGWVIQQFVFFYYLLRILPFLKALKRWNKFELYLMKSN